MNKGDLFTHEFKIDEKLYRGFIELFNDRNPLHTDESFASKRGFKKVIMHGNILGGFISYFIGELLPTKSVIIHSQEIKYYNPLYLNQPLKFAAKVEDVFESVHVVEFSFIFQDEEQQKIAKGKVQIGII